MESVLRCDCGFEARADNEPELVAGVQRHALEVHGMEFSPEDVLRLAIRTGSGVEGDRNRLSRSPWEVHLATRPKKEGER
jgi:predicted small metal-binding protein